MAEMSVTKKVGFSYCEFNGTPNALNSFARLKAYFGAKGIGISYPHPVNAPNGTKIMVASPGRGEIAINKTANSTYQVYLIRGRLSSLIAWLSGKYN